DLRSSSSTKGRKVMRQPDCYLSFPAIAALPGSAYAAGKMGGSAMTRIKNIETGHYRIPLPVTLSDSTHGQITAFELITVRVHDTDGAEGVGYTYTVGRNGGAVADILRREVGELIEGCEAADTEAIWHRIWWGLHYGGRGGPAVLALSAIDIALWD